MAYTIPIELIEMLKQRRCIPFLGAGFSAGHSLPNWDNLLRQISVELTGIPDYDEIRKCCNNDHLQIAEYLFIKSDKSIGPLRHKLSAMLDSKMNPVDSTAHVELVNLNAQQIYTTNYDEIIEKTFRALEHPHAFIALAKHIATADRSKTEVVKYHGDLRYDSSLVLTESSYYGRLEFESPMDLKFRSDLLGQSVLFIGYSFRDINIRIIWFRLMEMMKDVPVEDRPSSYIIRFEKNEVLEDLYRAVGIKTICIDPEAEATTDEAKTKLLGDFMIELSSRVAPDGKMPGSKEKMYFSKGLAGTLLKSTEGKKSNRLYYRAIDPQTSRIINHAINRRIPNSMISTVDECIEQLSKPSINYVVPSEIISWAIYLINDYQIYSYGTCYTVLRALERESSRDILLKSKSQIKWELIWEMKLRTKDAEHFIKSTINELESHEEGRPDLDLAYMSEIALRISNGALKVDQNTKQEQGKDVTNIAQETIQKISEQYPSVKNIKINQSGLSDLAEMIGEIDAEISRVSNFDEDITFIE